MEMLDGAERETSPLWTQRNPRKLVIILAILLVITVLAAMSIGRYYVEPLSVFKALSSAFASGAGSVDPTVRSVILDIRLPRVIAGFLVGAGLAVAGASFQGMFRNPLVSSQILGVASGAGFGAAIAILLFESLVIVQISSFLFGLVSVLFTYLLSRVNKTTPILWLVLAGIVVGSLFSALTSLTKYIADPLNKMPAIVFWLLGSLNNVTNKDVAVLGSIIFASLIVLFLIRWRINVLTMGEEDARALGVNTERLKAVIIVLSTLMTAASVCMCGIIGWIGLVIPHIGRILVGPNYRHLIPVSILAGGIFLVAVDTVCRSVTASEIPLGILTSVIGAPLFAYLLRRSKVGG